MKFKKNIDFDSIYRDFENKAQKALFRAGYAILSDVKTSKTIPIESGNLQNNATDVDASNLRNNTLWVYSSTVYARRKYFNPEFNFNRKINRFASGRWFEPYITGNRRDYAFKFYCDDFRKSIREKD